MDSQLKRGLLVMCILKLLEEDRYGYDLIKEMQNYFVNTEESTLYGILRRLNQEGLTELYYNDVTHGAKRKYYKLTPAGKNALAGYISDWEEIIHILDDIGITGK
jgi:PadR family transcriptional regulator PadR